MLIYMLVVVLGLVIFHVATRYSNKAKLVNQIPGPVALPILGNLLNFNLTSEKIWDIIHYYNRKYYPIFRLWLNLTSPSVFISHPDDLKVLLSCKTNIDKSETVYGNIKFSGSDGLILSGGNKWRKRRKMINPAFNPNMLKVYLEVLAEHIERLIMELKSEKEEVVLDLEPFFLKFALAVVTEATMGVNLSKFEPKREEEYRHSFDEISEIAFYRASRPYIRDWMMRFLSIGRRFDHAVKIASAFADEIITERRKYHESTQYQYLKGFDDTNDVANDVNTTAKLTSVDNRKRLSVLDLLLAAEMDGLIDKDGIQEEIDDFIAAGYETSSTTICFCLLLLAENKEAQDRVRAEVSSVFKENDSSTTMAEIQKLDYLDRVVKETLRLFPTGPLIGRKLVEELHLKNYVLPESVEVIVLFYALHRDPNFWPEPTKFDPDRFLPENMKNRHPYAYLPFSSGPRSCIGQRFGMMEIKAMMAYILHNFYIEPIDYTADIKFKMHVTLKPRHHIHAKFIRIERNDG